MFNDMIAEHSKKIIAEYNKKKLNQKENKENDETRK